MISNFKCICRNGLRVKKISNLQWGFTLIEVVIVILILGVLATMPFAYFDLYQKKSPVDLAANEFATIIRVAQSKSLASENDSKYGIYLDYASLPNKYVLFKGSSYAARDVSLDQIYFLPNIVEFYDILIGGGNEIIFEKVNGFTNQSGSASMRLKSDASQQKTVYLSNSGMINFSAPNLASDAVRVKDSRHVHVDYSRAINTNSEKIILSFEGGVQHEILILQYLSNGQIYWSGKVSVGGIDQIITISTHALNNPGSQFSIHRDRRYNTKSLAITLSGDSSGSIAQYSADGLITSISSIYASNLIWQ